MKKTKGTFVVQCIKDLHDDRW